MVVLPGDPVDKTAFDALLQELVDTNQVRRFESEGREYGAIRSFKRFQKPKKPNPCYPFPPEMVDYVGETDSEPMENADGKTGSGVGGERKGSGGKGRAVPLPEDFAISERVKAWAEAKGYARIDEHLESFKSKCRAKGYAYVDWDEAFMNAIRSDWAKLNTGTPAATGKPWFIASASAIEAKARELGVDMSLPYPELRIAAFRAAGITREMEQKALKEFA
jgi:hypothetical protein